MKLYHSPTSPYVRKVMVLLHELGKLSNVELVAAGGSPVAPGTLPLQLNPLGKIPALERADGPALYDSPVISRFLDATFEGGLYPAAPRLWETLTLEATADGIMDAAILMVYEHKARPEGTQSPEWEEAQWAKIARTLDTLEDRWLAYLAGPLDAGHIALGCALGYLDLRHGSRGWRERHTGLANWYESFAARDSMLQTVPQG
ncbi:glutathione S-transferase [Algicella marina]|uniref:Glutathione S-transferase n=1 Tax=Algicella marina TaxID=2683284 RepID=A0A6P1T1S3_9RHOB|nr:glutathione S-transferase [Algicella marina]QHQ36688.1 glutathione S-transferase [Algicella marina]